MINYLKNRIFGCVVSNQYFLRIKNTEASEKLTFFAKIWV